MTRRLIVAAALIVTFGAFFQSKPPRIASNAPKTGMGLIEHRGKTYRIEDLTNPHFRGASNDPFVKTFAGQVHFAEPWADADGGW